MSGVCVLQALYRMPGLHRLHKLRRVCRVLQLLRVALCRRAPRRARVILRRPHQHHENTPGPGPGGFRTARSCERGRGGDGGVAFFLGWLFHHRRLGWWWIAAMHGASPLGPFHLVSRTQCCAPGESCPANAAASLKSAPPNFPRAPFAQCDSGRERGTDRQCTQHRCRFL